MSMPQDWRFAGQAWYTWPFNLFYQSFLLQQQWWHNATTGLRGITKRQSSRKFCRPWIKFNPPVTTVR
jgi:polyhydroxyalkanoate synthase subunit PhaC